MGKTGLKNNLTKPNFFNQNHILIRVWYCFIVAKSTFSIKNKWRNKWTLAIASCLRSQFT